MLAHLRPALLLLLALTLLTGIAYPLAMTGIAQLVFPIQANGSLVRSGDRVVGSELVGQAYDDPKWFWGRPSATAPPNIAASSGGSNQGPTSPALAAAVEAQVAA